MGMVSKTKISDDKIHAERSTSRKWCRPIDTIGSEQVHIKDVNF
jgi:hypothetical protein